MKLAVGLAVAHAAQVQQSTEVNPIRRVVTLLQNMQKEVTAEGKREQDLYEKFMCYCKGNTGNLSKDIEAGIAQATQLDADVKAKTARKAQLDQELVEHKADRKDAQATIAKATQIREKEHEEFLHESGDQKQYIEALSKAIPTLEKGMGVALLQTPRILESIKKAAMASQVTQMDKETVMSFLSSSSPYGNYSGASGEIVGILKQMKDDIDKDLGGIVSVEESAQRTFDELVTAKKSEIRANSEAIERKSVRSGELAVEITQDKNAFENAQKERSANEQFLVNLGKDCATKTGEWETRTKTRNEELLAISEAIKVLNDDDSLDIFKKTLPTPGAAAAVFLQTEQSRRVQAFALLQSAGVVSGDRSTQLGLLSYMLKQGKVSFDKVVKMIEDMVAHLEQEQKDDDKQRGWCQAEFEEKDDTKKELEGRIEDLTSEIDHNDATIEQLSSDIEALKNKLKELDDSVAAATEQRKSEHKEFVDNLTQLTAAQQLIEKAKNRLNKFYNPKLYRPPPQRELTEEERIAENMGAVLVTQPPKLIAGTNIALNLLQRDISLVDAKPEAPPSTWAAGGYQKKGQKSTGVIALMDLLAKDLASQAQEAEHDEKTAQEDYTELLADATKTRETDSKSLADKQSSKASTKATRGENASDRRGRGEELKNTNEVIAELHGSCDFLIANYDFRKEARGKERDALNNAKAVLSGANYA